MQIFIKLSSKMSMLEKGRKETSGSERIRSHRCVLTGREEASGHNGERRGGLFVKGRRNIADADHTAQAVIVDHGQVANMMLVHQVPNLFQRIVGAARHQLLNR